MTTTINNEHKELNFSSEREQSQACLNSAEHEKNQGRKVLNVPNSTDKGKTIRNVPHLRFPEFQGEWTISLLSDFLTENKERNKKGKFGKADVLSVSGDYGIVNQIELLGRSFAGASVLLYHIVRHGNIVYTKSPLKEYPYGIVKANTGVDGIVSTLYAVYNINNNADAQFIEYYFSSANRTNRYFKPIVRIGAKHDMKIGNQEVLANKVTFPNLEEQNKIASLFRLLDNRIATQNKIIEDLKKLKSAISKLLFAQKPNGWNRLDTLFSKGKAGGTPTSTNKEYYNGEIPFLSINDITKQGKYVRCTENYLSQSGLENSSAWVVPKYSLIMSMYASVGLVTINKMPLATSQAMFAMQLKNKDLLDYLYYYLSYFKYRYIHKYLETGTQSNINADIVRGIMIPTYGYSHNIEIASTLQGVDAKIDNELSVLEQLHRQKNYFLSQMFI